MKHAATLLCGLLLAWLAAATSLRAQSTGAYTVLHSFDVDDGEYTYARLVRGADGDFYGAATSNAASGGTIYRITPGGTATVLRSFIGPGFTIGGPGDPDGSLPTALTPGDDGNFYGTTLNSGAAGHGTAFRITPDGTFTVFYAFQDADGAPTGGILRGRDGNFYGTTGVQGSVARTVFRLTPTRVLTTLHRYSGTDGNGPSGLVEGRDGAFYGTTFGDPYPSPPGGGTVFRITAAGEFTTLYAFGPQAGGNLSGLILGQDGNFYGTSETGGTDRAGMVFKVTPQGALTVLHSFDFDAGTGPSGGVTLGRDGNLYGTTSGGGPYSDGTIYQLTPDGVLSTLYRFGPPGPHGDNADGEYPSSSVVEGEDGVFYGTTPKGGAHGYGVFFRVAVTRSPAPTLTAAAATPVVRPGGLADAFTFSLSKPSTVKMTIHFRLKGSAIRSRDYVLFPRRPKIYPGQTSVSVSVVALGDLGGEASKKLKLVLEPDPAYTVGTAGVVQIKIVQP